MYIHVHVLMYVLYSVDGRKEEGGREGEGGRYGMEERRVKGGSTVLPGSI